MNVQRFEIERNVPLPPVKRLGNVKGSRNVYPLDRLSVGESIMFYFPKPYLFRECYAMFHALGRAQTRIAELLGVKFERRMYDDGIRVWRVE